ncbi:hypothetical protein NC652_030356 [Populus alba x Populus x berolinensis]|nr:hypothetical protein NC652_030356 [Populus alba x Populus x berolinensis]
MEKMGTAEPNFEQLIVRRRSAFGTPSFPSFSDDSISQLGQVLNEISSGLSKGLLCPYGLALLSTMGITHGKKPREAFPAYNIN